MKYTDDQIKDLILGQLYMEKASVYVSEITARYNISIDPEQLELILFFLQVQELIYGQYKHKDWQIGLFEKGRVFCEETSFGDSSKPINPLVNENR
jgi:hypothetical protein